MIFIIFITMVIFYWLLSSLFSFHFIVPDLFFIYTFLINYYYTPSIAVSFSFFSGVYADFCYDFPFGTHALGFVILSFVINSIKQKVEIASLFARVFNFIIFNYLFVIFVIILDFIINREFTGYILFLQPLINIPFLEIVNKLFLKVLKKNYVKL